MTILTSYSKHSWRYSSTYSQHTSARGFAGFPVFTRLLAVLACVSVANLPLSSPGEVFVQRTAAMGIDLIAGGRNKKTARTAPKSDNVYLKLLVKVSIVHLS